MTHDYHEGQPGYSDKQILHDGCDECAAKSKDIALAIGKMDPRMFARAWARSAQLNREGLTDGAHAELPVLKVLWAIQVQLENNGVPIGFVPYYMHE